MDPIFGIGEEFAQMKNPIPGICGKSEQPLYISFFPKKENHIHDFEALLDINTNR
jgi:hypothetical protein